MAGDYADLYVDATGTPPLTYQWKFLRVGGVNPVNLTGATNDMWLIPAVQAGDAGSYTVLVTSAAGGKVTSSNVALTVLVPPAITRQPQAKVVGGVLGANATFSVTATGTAPVSYQRS